jgi:hypothetical protein
MRPSVLRSVPRLHRFRRQTGRQAYDHTAFRRWSCYSSDWPGGSFPVSATWTHVRICATPKEHQISVYNTRLSHVCVTPKRCYKSAWARNRHHQPNQSPASRSYCSTPCGRRSISSASLSRSLQKPRQSDDCSEPRYAMQHGRQSRNQSEATTLSARTTSSLQRNAHHEHLTCAEHRKGSAGLPCIRALNLTTGRS